MIEIIAYTLVGLGLIAGAVLFARRPEFWIEFGWRIAAKLAPIVWTYMSQRMPEEEEAAWRAAERAGRGDEWLRERWRRKRRKGLGKS